MRIPPAFRRLITLLALCLQALDALTVVAGHSHEACDEHYAGMAASECEHSDHEPGSSSEDDCTICRHIGQPVAPVLFAIELVGSERVEAYVPAHPRAVVSTIAVVHLARGPPLLGA